MAAIDLLGIKIVISSKRELIIMFNNLALSLGLGFMRVE